MTHPPLLVGVFPMAVLALWLGFALLQVVYPRFVWWLRYSWRATAEPPPLYWWTMRLQGLLGIAVAVGFVLLLVFARPHLP